MTDRPLGAPRPEPEPADGPTRDIRLPPLAGHPRAHVPAQWGGTSSREGAAVDEHEPLQEQPVAASESTVVLRPGADEVPAADAREQTRPFVPPAQHHRPAPAAPAPAAPAPAAPAPAAPAPAAREGGRASTWVLLILLPILVIAAAGLLLFLVFNGG
jgi:hypothetical protein